MNEKKSRGRMRRFAVTLVLAGVGLTGVAGVGTYEAVQATKSSTSTSTSNATTGGLAAGSGSSMTTSGGS